MHQPAFKKNMSSPSKMYKQFNPNYSQHQASKSPYRNGVRDNSEATSISYTGNKNMINISPMKQSLSKYCNDKGNTGGSSI